MIFSHRLTVIGRNLVTWPGFDQSWWLTIFSSRRTVIGRKPGHVTKFRPITVRRREKNMDCRRDRWWSEMSAKALSLEDFISEGVFKLDPECPALKYIHSFIHLGRRVHKWLYSHNRRWSNRADEIFVRESFSQYTDQLFIANFFIRGHFEAMHV